MLHAVRRSGLRRRTSSSSSVIPHPPVPVVTSVSRAPFLTPALHGRSPDRPLRCRSRHRQQQPAGRRRRPRTACRSLDHRIAADGPLRTVECAALRVLVGEQHTAGAVEPDTVHSPSTDGDGRRRHRGRVARCPQQQRRLSEAQLCRGDFEGTWLTFWTTDSKGLGRSPPDQRSPGPTACNCPGAHPTPASRASQRRGRGGLPRPPRTPIDLPLAGPPLPPQHLPQPAWQRTRGTGGARPHQGTSGQALGHRLQSARVGHLAREASGAAAPPLWDLPCSASGYVRTNFSRVPRRHVIVTGVDLAGQVQGRRHGRSPALVVWFVGSDRW
jgi:hypothetical protein